MVGLLAGGVAVRTVCVPLQFPHFLLKLNYIVLVQEKKEKKNS